MNIQAGVKKKHKILSQNLFEKNVSRMECKQSGQMLVLQNISVIDDAKSGEICIVGGSSYRRRRSVLRYFFNDWPFRKAVGIPESGSISERNGSAIPPPHYRSPPRAHTGNTSVPDFARAFDSQERDEKGRKQLFFIAFWKARAKLQFLFRNLQLTNVEI